MARTNVFISYSRRDAVWLERLQVHLKPLERSGLLTVWDDTRLEPGSNWRAEIRDAIARARAAVILISADFIASDFIATNELPPLLAAAADDGVLILPVIISPSLFEKIPELARFQSVNRPDKPLKKLRQTGREAVFLEVAKSLQQAFGATEGERGDVNDSTNASGVVSAVVSAAPPIAKASAPTKSENVLEVLAVTPSTDLISLLLREVVTLGDIDSAIARDATAASKMLNAIAHRTESDDSDGWLRMLCAYATSRESRLVQDALSIAFDDRRHWGIRTAALSWLRFAPNDERRSIATGMYRRAKEAQDVDTTRLAISGAGYVGQAITISSLVADFDAKTDDYYNEKLGPYAVTAYLDCFIRYGREWHPLSLLDAMSELYEITERKGHLHRAPYDYLDRLQLLDHGSAITLLEHLVRHRHRPILEALVYMLSCRPPKLIQRQLLALVRQTNSPAAVMALARIQAPDTVDVLDNLRGDGVAVPAAQYFIGIGTNHVRRHRDQILEAVRDGFAPAVWAVGELARDGDAELVKALRESSMAQNGLTRAMSWIGLAKAREAVTERELSDAMSATIEHAEMAVFGIAAGLLGFRGLFARGINATQLRLEPIQRLEGFLFGDFLEALEACGEGGRALLELQRCGDID